MKLEEGLNFDRNTLKVTGFVDLGNETPAGSKNKKEGDHALVVLFQPYRGQWIQSLGCFLAKGNVKGDMLAKLILEGVALTEASGLKVDGVVTDGATWNRNMWSKFGVGEKKSWTVHPLDESRKLWFMSDWCHLLKCMRNTLCPELPAKKRAMPQAIEVPQAAGDETTAKEQQAAAKKLASKAAKAAKKCASYNQDMHNALHKEIKVNS
jgi:hypothetical protein